MGLGRCIHRALRQGPAPPAARCGELADHTIRSLWQTARSSSGPAATPLPSRKIDPPRIFAGTNACVITYTEKSKFAYKGAPNEDTVLYTVVLEKRHVAKTWMIVHIHRATGQ